MFKFWLKIVFLVFCTSNATSYNETEARQTLYLAAVTFCRPDLIASWTCGNPCEHNPQFQPLDVISVPVKWGTNSTAYYGFDGDEFVVAFQGSVTNLEIAAEGMFSYQSDYKPMQLPGVYVEDDFQNIYLEFRRHILAGVKRYVKPGMKVRVTGHSLGAANAALCGFDLASTGFVPSDSLYVYTYGEPRVGNKAFAQMFDKIVPNAWRLVHYADLVPHLPFMNWVFEKYEHHSHEIWYNYNFTEYTVCGPNEDPGHCADSMPMTSWAWKDHDWYFNYGLGHFTLCPK